MGLPALRCFGGTGHLGCGRDESLIDAKTQPHVFQRQKERICQDILSAPCLLKDWRSEAKRDPLKLKPIEVGMKLFERREEKRLPFPVELCGVEVNA